MNQNQTHDTHRPPPVLYVEDDHNDVVLMRYAWTKVGVLNPLQVATDDDAALRYLSGVNHTPIASPIRCRVWS
jgi:hypothetical protein